MSLLIKLEHVTKIYCSNSSKFIALKNINFELASGEMLAIMGASGSGKSTLMNIMGFLDRPTTGKYLFSGRDVSHLSDDELAEIRNRKIGFVFQSFFLLPRLTALQNVMLPLFYRGVEEELAKETALAMLEKVKVEDFATHQPNQLSGGQQQRVAIARALVGNPEVIFADEPTGALDSKTGKKLMDLLIHLNQVEGRTIIIVTHDKAIGDFCKRIVEIKDGVLISQ